MIRSIAAALVLFALPAFADEAPAPDLEGAKKALSTYLDAVKAKKWDVAKKQIHPRTLESIADLKKRTGIENHALAPWARVKESYLTKYEIRGGTPSVRGAAVFKVSEDNYSVEEKGVEEGAAAEYFLIPIDGTWYVTDKRVGEDQFPEASIGASYKGYFQGEFEPAKAAPPKKGGKKK